MTNDHWSYDLIKAQISKRNITGRELDDLVDAFADSIGSPRRLSCVQDLGDLLEYLERQDVFDESNVEALKCIGQTLDDDKICRIVSQYEPVEEKGERENLYALQRLQEEFDERVSMPSEMPKSAQFDTKINEPKPDACGNYPPPPPANNSESPNSFAGKKREAIYKLIILEIGRKWRDLGRGLGVREGEMDGLENDYPRDSKTRIRKMLNLFEEDDRVDPKQRGKLICQALESCKRKDLSRGVQEILFT